MTHTPDTAAMEIRAAGGAVEPKPIRRPVLTVLCPVHNEEATVPLFYARIAPVLNALRDRYRPRLVFLNNASKDNTLEAVRRLRAERRAAGIDDVGIITLASNVGYQRSVEGGLRTIKSDLYCIIDVDCEDPPEMLPRFLAEHERGYDVVYGERADRPEAAWLKNTRKLFYRLTRLIADEDIILDMAEFSLFTGEVRDAIIRDHTSFPFIRSSIARLGFARTGIAYTREPRIAGQTHYNLIGMTTFAIAGILSSTTLFLRLPLYALIPWALVVGALGVIGAVTGALWVTPVLIALIGLYLGFAVSFTAVYVARTYKNTLGRPNAVPVRRSTHLPPDLEVDPAVRFHPRRPVDDHDIDEPRHEPDPPTIAVRPRATEPTTADRD